MIGPGAETPDPVELGFAKQVQGHAPTAFDQLMAKVVMGNAQRLVFTLQVGASRTIIKLNETWPANPRTLALQWLQSATMLVWLVAEQMCICLQIPQSGSLSVADRYIQVLMYL